MCACFTLLHTSSVGERAVACTASASVRPGSSQAPRALACDVSLTLNLDGFADRCLGARLPAAMLWPAGGTSRLRASGERAMKVLFVWDSAEYLRFFDSVVEECLARGHEVAIAYNKTNIKKLGGLRGLRAIEGRVRVLGLVPRHKGMWRRIAYGLRGTMDFVRYFHPRFTVATAARARMKRKALPAGYRWLDRIPRLPPAAVRALERLLATVERAIPVHQPIVDFLQREGPDVMLVSPLVDCGSDQVDIIKAARACGVRTAVCVASWDNLTNKGVLRIEPDLVVVWNDAQKREAQDYHYIPARQDHDHRRSVVRQVVRHAGHARSRRLLRARRTARHATVSAIHGIVRLHFRIARRGGVRPQMD